MIQMENSAVNNSTKQQQQLDTNNNETTMNPMSMSCGILSSESSSASSSMNNFTSQQQAQQQAQQVQQQQMQQNIQMIDENNNIMQSLNTQGTFTNMMEEHSICGDQEDPNFNDFSSKTNLIVNYLPQNMTQEEIKALFSSIGQVDSCKLIKDKLSGQSLGYAFVNFARAEDADKSIATLNGMRLQNKTIKVSLARPSSDSIKNANLYVCGLPKEFTQADLEQMFQPFGVIISSKILTDPKTNVSKGVGFVRFDQRIEAETAINTLNNKIHGNIPEPLIVKFANSPTSIKSVMGLPLAPFVPMSRGFYQPYRQSTNSSYRYSPMSAYCPETNMLQQQQQLSGMITPTSTSLSLTSTLNCGVSNSQSSIVLPILPQSQQPTTPIQGQPGIGLNASPPATSISNSSLSSVNYSGWCIFVYNLGPESDESILWQLFGPFGAVQSVKIIRDVQTQKCKGFGFITMTNYEEAVTAINCLNGLNLQNRILQVSFKTSKPFF